MFFKNPQVASLSAQTAARAPRSHQLGKRTAADSGVYVHLNFAARRVSQFKVRLRQFQLIKDLAEEKEEEMLLMQLACMHVVALFTGCLCSRGKTSFSVASILLLTFIPI